MARRVQWTEVGLRDLDEVAAYIARDSRYYAAGFVRKVRNAARSLDHMPGRGRIVPEFEDPSVRELIVGRYRLIYHVTDQLERFASLCSVSAVGDEALGIA